MRPLLPALLAVLLAACAPEYRTWTPPVRPMPAPPRPVKAPPSAPVAPVQTMAAAPISDQPRTYYQPTPQEIESANIGAMPDNYETLVRDFLHTRLYQPDDAKFRFSRAPRKDYRPGYSRQTTLFAWSIGAYVNAKNVTGKYTGEDFHLFFVVNGRIVAHSNVDADLRRFTIGSR